MPRESGTAALLGREREQAELYDALSLVLSGRGQTVLVGGDGGIGKTTLVSDLAGRAEEQGFTVVVGHCLDLGAGISFAPVVEAVRSLVMPLEDLDARPSARRMRALLDPETPRRRQAFRVLEDLRLTVLEAAAAGPLMLVLEDMHWADRSTQDFAVALSRTAKGRLLLVLTVRADDLHRRHPARRSLAEISRIQDARHVDLHPLDADSIAAIVKRHAAGGPVDPAQVRSAVERSEGNPLYAEELAAADPDAMPGHLAHLFLARMDALADRPRELLRLASVDGTRLDIDTLGEFGHLDRGQLDTLLRVLLDANLLRGTRDSLTFRHGLLREAVYDDLLPDERARLHSDLAAILQAKADAMPEPGLTVLSRLAFHWYAAHDLPRTLEASVCAGALAWRMGAAEAVAHRQRALSLWDQVPDAEVRAGCTKVDLLLALARASCDQGDLHRWHELNTRAVDMLTPGTHPWVASRAHSSFATSAIFNGDLTGAQEAVRRAVEHAGDSATEERAYALGARALLHDVNGQFAAGLVAADRAIQDARASGAIDALLLALMFRSDALLLLGRVTEACAAVGESIDVARDAGMVEWTLGSVGLLAGRLMESGQVAQGLSVARVGYRDDVAGELTLHPTCGESTVTALIWGGRLESADSLLEELRRMPLPRARWRHLHGELSLARGDDETASHTVPEPARYPELARRHPDDVDVLREVRLADLRHDESTCVEVAEACLGRLEGCDSPLLAASAARIGFHALTVGRPASEARGGRLHGQAARQLERARVALTDEWSVSYFGVQLALAEAYAARCAGESAVTQFRDALALAEPFGTLFALEPRLELALELLSHGARDAGKELLVRCWGTAHDLGAHGLERQAFRIATRFRVPLPESATTEGPLSRLTPREREVFDRLATGATNKAIASVLVISEKTVSVHVSNVLAKLGVENRGAAAALARRLVG
jgi:DNA-binding CsgD family transcriptional regulator/tetratricopeptide (TPR) repeat protein